MEVINGQRDVLRHIFRLMEPAEVAKSKAVCKVWRDVLEEVPLLREVFRREWGLTRLVGEPLKPSFYLQASLASFVLKHNCTRRDMLTTLSVKYDVPETDLKRVNNLMSEYGLMSRSHIYIPVRSRALCGSKRAQFVYDSVICRHLVVLLEDAEALAPSALTESPRKAPLPDSEVEARVAFMLARGMRVSHDTAKYYLREAQGDIQRAFHLLEDDNELDLTSGALSFTRY